MRHTFCTRCYENGVDVFALSKVMGHRSINVTTEIYTTCTEGFRKRAFGFEVKEKYPDTFTSALRRDNPIPMSSGQNLAISNAMQK